MQRRLKMEAMAVVSTIMMEGLVASSTILIQQVIFSVDTITIIM